LPCMFVHGGGALLLAADLQHRPMVELLVGRRADVNRSNADQHTALMVALERGGDARVAAARRLRGSVLRLSFEPEGCRVVQAALQCAPRDEAVGMASELHWHVWRALGSPQANYVLQKVVQTLPATLSGFVATELAGKGVEAARHKFGCRIVCRLIEHTALSAATSALLGEILAEADKLSRHSFGHHVVQSILEHGQPQQRARVVEALRGDLLRCSLNRNSSYVVDKALTYCGPEDRAAMAAELLACPGDLLQLAGCQFGFHVVKTLTMVPGRHAKIVLDAIAHEAALIKESKYGKRLLEDLGLNSA